MPDRSNINNGLNKSIIGPVLDVENITPDRTTRNTPIFNSISIFIYWSYKFLFIWLVFLL